ncbi:MAG: CAP domain-containing protein [Luteolibacter sp.]
MLFSVAAVCLGGTTSCSLWQRWTPKKEVVTYPAGKTAEEKVFYAVNGFRGNHGRAPLVRHPGLDAIARRHAQAMARAGKIHHKGLSAREAEARQTLGLQSFGENLGRAGTVDPSPLLGMWANSSMHRSNLMGKWSQTGIGAARGRDGALYVVQLFGH